MKSNGPSNLAENGIRLLGVWIQSTDELFRRNLEPDESISIDTGGHDVGGLSSRRRRHVVTGLCVRNR